MRFPAQFCHTLTLYITSFLGSYNYIYFSFLICILVDKYCGDLKSLLHYSELFVKTKLVQTCHPPIFVLPKSTDRSNTYRTQAVLPFALGAEATALSHPLDKMGSHGRFKITPEFKTGPNLTWLSI